MIRLISIVLAVIFSGCGFDEEVLNSESNMITEHINFISNKYLIHPFGRGGFNEDGLKGYSLTFESNERVDVVQARNLIVNMLEDIIKNNNGCQNTQCKTKLSYRNFKVAVLFSDKNSQKFISDDLGIASVRVSQGNVYYSVDKRGNYQLETIFEEPYSEAYEKVTGKKFVEEL